MRPYSCAGGSDDPTPGWRLLRSLRCRVLDYLMAKVRAKKGDDTGAEGSAGKRPESGYWSGSHSLHRLRFHMVFVPKYRKRVLEGMVAARIAELFAQACDVMGWELHELSVQPDHVHLLIQVNPRDSIAGVARRLKGGSSRVIRSEFPDLVEFLWGDSFWSDGYFSESVGQREEHVIRRYIQNQGKANRVRDD